MLTKYVAILPKEGLDKHEELYLEFVRNKNIWRFAYHADPALRTAVYRALMAMMDSRPGMSPCPHCKHLPTSEKLG